MSRLKDYIPLYTSDDKEKLLSVLEEKQKIISDYKNKYITPTLQKKKEVMEIVAKYIKKHQLKIYGGHAQNLTIKKYFPAKQFYTDPDDLHDYDTYSTDPVKDGIKLANKLYKKGYSGILFRDAMHFETYSLIYEGFTICDLTYVPKKIFANIPCETIDGFVVCKALFYIIDFLRMFTDPVSSAFRWDKQIERFMLIQSVFPVPDIKEPLLLDDIKMYPQIKPEYKKAIRKYIKTTDNNLLITGFYAYNKYVSLNNQNKRTKHIYNTEFKKFKNPYFTFICTNNYKENVNKFVEYLKMYFKNEITINIREKYKFFQFKDYCAEIYLNDEHVATIYKNNNICVPYVSINNVKYCSFQYNLMFTYISAFYANNYNEGKPLRDLKEKLLPKYAENEFHKIAVNMVKMRDNYLHDYKLSFLDPSPYEDFIVLCNGDILTPQQIKSQSVKHYYGVKYDPSKDNPSKYNNKLYTNTSGGYIYNEKDLKLKN